MVLPVMTALVIVFIVWMNYEIHKSTKQSAADIHSFWNHEQASNLVPRSDITALDYIDIATQTLPMKDHPDETVNSYRDILKELSGHKALNLSSYSNTELKLRFGLANISQLTDYDNNYTLLVSILQKWAERLNKLGYGKDAISVLEYALACHTDVINSYLLLTQLYHSNGEPDKIMDLIKAVTNTDIHDKERLIGALSASLSKQLS